MSAITISEERGVRYLHFGSPWVQGAMRIARPWALELEYTRDLMFPLLLRPEMEWPASVLQIGLGSASITKFLYRNRPHARLTVVEILPEVVAAANQYFRLPVDPERLHLVVGDGHEYLQKRGARFDLIVVDGFDSKGRPGLLDTEAFYLNCHERLAKGGIMSVNLLTRRRGTDASVSRIRHAFEEQVVELPPSDAGNAVVVATTGPEYRWREPELKSAAKDLHAATGLNLLSAVARLAEASRGGERP
ncbi:MAG TPA: fused MFS/spermidine synthase [Usitatibacter sp.]|nr:fused MFS/spermidine synthase [Usitatibacter sp.]